MATTLDYCVVDAFASERFSGNPAAIVFGAELLDEKRMKAVASEFNLSETVFVLPAEDAEASQRIRWFTPTVEVAMCGHATLAAAHALHQSKRVMVSDVGLLALETASGVLHLRIEDPAPGDGLASNDAGHSGLIWLLLPPPSFAKPPSGIEQLLGIMDLAPEVLDAQMEPVLTQDSDLIVFVRDFMSLQSARPEFAALRQHCERRRIRGVCMSTTNTLSAETHVQSRFFAPMTGVNEDPVTGSVHGPLAAYLVKMGRVSVIEGMATINCVQSVSGGRAGMIQAVVRINQSSQYEVAIAGRCVTTMSGKLYVD